MESKLKRLLCDFRWTRFDTAYQALAMRGSGIWYRYPGERLAQYFAVGLTRVSLAEEIGRFLDKFILVFTQKMCKFRSTRE